MYILMTIVMSPHKQVEQYFDLGGMNNNTIYKE